MYIIMYIYIYIYICVCVCVCIYCMLFYTHIRLYFTQLHCHALLFETRRWRDSWDLVKDPKRKDENLIFQDGNMSRIKMSRATRVSLFWVTRLVSKNHRLVEPAFRTLFLFVNQGWIGGSNTATQPRPILQKVIISHNVLRNLAILTYPGKQQVLL